MRINLGPAVPSSPERVPDPDGALLRLQEAGHIDCAASVGDPLALAKFHTEVTELLSASASTELVSLRRSPSIHRSIDNTALDAYMTCEWKHFASMVLSRRNRGAPPPPLAYGTAWHAGMEAHYRTGGNHAEVQRAIILTWEQHSKPEDHRTLQRCLLEYDRYVERYGLSDFHETVGYPDSPLVEIPTEAAWPSALHPYCGKIDRIINLGGLYYVEDHKTTSALGQYFFKQFDPNNQMMGYAWLAQLLTGLPIAGVRINAHAVLKTTSKFERDIVSFSQDRLIEWGENYNAWVERLERSYSMLASIIASLEDPNDLREMFAHSDLIRAFPRNFNACAGKYGACTYVNVCGNPPRVRAQILEQDFAQIEWDPMAADEEGEAE